MRAVSPATPDDLPALLALDPIAARNVERREAIARWVAQGQCHVACLDGAIVGYAALTEQFFHAPFLEMLMVAEPARRRGVARALVTHCIGLLPPDAKLWTSTNQSNTPMRMLLPALDFVPSGRIDNLDEGDPELIYLHWTGLQG